MSDRAERARKIGRKIRKYLFITRTFRNSGPLVEPGLSFKAEDIIEQAIREAEEAARAEEREACAEIADVCAEIADVWAVTKSGIGSHSQIIAVSMCETAKSICAAIRARGMT